MTNIYSEDFIFDEAVITYNKKKSSLIYKPFSKDRNRWIRSIEIGYIVTNITYGENQYYISTENDEFSGVFWAIRSIDGTTVWSIPGKSFINIFYNKFVYTIFVDNSTSPFLLKVSPLDGSKIWGYRIHIDLIEYTFSKNRLILSYPNNYSEEIDIDSGNIKLK